MTRFALTSPRPRLSEKDVAEACLALAALRGYRTERQNAGKFKTYDGRHTQGAKKGTPDYIALHSSFPGFYLETKRPGGKLSAEQVAKRNEIELGFRVPVCVADDLAIFNEWLNEHERKAVERWTKRLGG